MRTSGEAQDVMPTVDGGVKSGLSDLLRNLLPVRVREPLHRQLNWVRSHAFPEPYRTVLPYTMVSVSRLKSLDELARRIDSDGIAGDAVECGTCNGGSAAIIGRVTSKSPHGRHLWLLDSFQGLPDATEKDGASAAQYTGLCRGAECAVREVLKKTGVPETAVTLVPGWFNETLPTLTVSRIALLHIDADWYESVLQVLDALWDRVTPGGFVTLDDYGYWEGCRRAWEEFSARRGIQVELVPIDGIGVYLRKPV
jgi:O-methyltransferase